MTGTPKRSKSTVNKIDLSKDCVMSRKLINDELKIHLELSLSEGFPL